MFLLIGKYNITYSIGKCREDLLEDDHAVAAGLALRNALFHQEEDAVDALALALDLDLAITRTRSSHSLVHLVDQ